MTSSNYASLHAEICSNCQNWIIVYNVYAKFIAVAAMMKLLTYLTKNWLLLQCKVYFFGGKRPYYKYTVSQLREIGVKIEAFALVYGTVTLEYHFVVNSSELFFPAYRC